MPFTIAEKEDDLNPFNNVREKEEESQKNNKEKKNTVRMKH